MHSRKDKVVFGLMMIGNMFFFAAYLLGMFWNDEQ
jgi:hypothetical protein